MQTDWQTLAWPGFFFIALFFTTRERNGIAVLVEKRNHERWLPFPFDPLQTFSLCPFLYWFIITWRERERLLDWMSFWSTLKAFKACKQSRSKSPLLLVTFQTIFGDLQTVCVSRMKVTKQSKDLWTIEIIDECEKDIRDSRHFPVNHERISSIPTIQNSISNSILWWRST